MTNGLVFDEKTHRYFLDGVRVPSTTGILGAINKPFLLKWYGDNGTAEAKRLSKEAADFGTRVHKGCQSVGLGHSHHSYPVEEWQCIQAYASWFFTHVRSVIAVETPVASRLHQMAGTPDLVAVLEGEIEVRRPSGLIERVDMSGETAVLDAKTSSSVGDDFALQLEGYRRMLMEWLGIEPTRRLVVHMPRKAPGKLEIVEFPMETALDDWRAFLSALVLWHRLFKTRAFAERAVGKLPRPAAPRERSRG